MSNNRNRFYHLWIKLCCIILPLISCGIREDNSPFTNQLSGKWTLKNFECFLGNELTESFTIDTAGQSFELEFDGRSVDYTMTGTCNESTNGRYVFSYSSFSTGIISFTDLLIGNSCDLVVIENDSRESVSLDFQINSSVSNDLIWRVSEGSLSLLNFNSFSGTNDACDTRCDCYGVWDKI